MKLLQWIAFCMLVKTVAVAGDYVLEISRSSYNNPEERDAVGNCCIDNNGTAPMQGVCPDSCNTTLWICVQDSDLPPSDSTCSIGMGTIPQTLSSLSIFSQRAWPGSFQLDILVINDQSETLGALVPEAPIPPGSLIDVIYVNDVSLAASTPPSPVMEFAGNFSQTTLSLSFQVTCALNFFGADCNSTCVGRDDALGHFTCDPQTGNRVCLPGYQNPAVDCTDCVPLDGCSSIGGFCVDPGECICRDGYFGDLCTENSTLVAPSATAPPLTMSVAQEGRQQTSVFIRSSLEEVFSITSTSSAGVMTSTSSNPTSSSSIPVSFEPSPSQPASIRLSQTLLSTRSTLPSSDDVLSSIADFTQISGTSSNVLQTPQPTGLGVQPTGPGVLPGGVGVRTSNTTIVWISVSVTVGASLLVVVSVLVFLAIAYSVRKEKTLQKKEETGSQFFGLIHNANANNHSSEDAVPETLNNRRDIERHNEQTQTHNVLTSESRDTIPDATYTTFQDSGHYSIRLLTEDEFDSVSEGRLNASVFSNSVAIQTEAPSPEKQELEQIFVPKFSSDSEKDLMDVKGEFVEPDFHLLTEESSFSFHNNFEHSLGGDLLSCIEESLSHSTQTNNYFPEMIEAFSHSTDSTTEDKLTAESDFAPSFIYADHVDGGGPDGGMNENEFRLPSVSPEL